MTYLYSHNVNVFKYINDDAEIKRREHSFAQCCVNIGPPSVLMLAALGAPIV